MTASSWWTTRKQSARLSPPCSAEPIFRLARPPAASKPSRFWNRATNSISVLSDLMMAEMDGIALLERAKERYPDMPIVMVTAVHDIQVALQALRNGAYDYLLKPFEREQLLATVRRALENRRLKRENDAYRTNLEALRRRTYPAMEDGAFQPGKVLRHHARSPGRCARPQGRRDRRPLPARHRLHHRHCAQNGPAERETSTSSPAEPSCTTSARWPFPTPSCASPASSRTTKWPS